MNDTTLAASEASTSVDLLNVRQWCHDARSTLSVLTSFVESYRQRSEPPSAEQWTLLSDTVFLLCGMIDNLALTTAAAIHGRQEVNLADTLRALLPTIVSVAELYAVGVKIKHVATQAVVMTSPEVAATVMRNLMMTVLEACSEGDQMYVELTVDGRHVYAMCDTPAKRQTSSTSRGLAYAALKQGAALMHGATWFGEKPQGGLFGLVVLPIV